MSAELRVGAVLMMHLADIAAAFRRGRGDRDASRHKLDAPRERTVDREHLPHGAATNRFQPTRTREGDAAGTRGGRRATSRTQRAAAASWTRSDLRLRTDLTIVTDNTAASIYPWSLLAIRKSPRARFYRGMTSCWAAPRSIDRSDSWMRV